MVWEWMIYTAIGLLILIVLYELLHDRMIHEGFTDGDKQIPEFFGRFFPKRYDVLPGQQREGDGWIRNSRYFEGYVDVQRLGYKADFCRVVEKEGDPESRIMACALAGQEGLDSLTFRTDSMRSGMQFSRDDYFRDVNGDKRDDYCRILKVAKAPHDAWEARCVPAGITRFRENAEIQDTEPPQHISDLLWFFEGAMVWYRWVDDMLDYAENSRLLLAGDVKIDETPGKQTTKGLSLNRLPTTDSDIPPPAEQFLKIGENDRMEFDSLVDLRQFRAFSAWVYFDEFTNNARIFDFGNGAGKDNVFLGIQGRGNKTTSEFGNVGARPTDANLVCQAKAPKEVSPLAFLESTDANIELWDCPGPEPVQSMFPPDEQKAAVEQTANLLFEIWDAKQRKMRVLVQDAIPYRKWVHIALSTKDMDAVRPTWVVFVNGKKVYEHADGFLPLNSYTTKNYIGKSNWETTTSQYDDRDERFRGAMFDFRMYRTPMSVAKVKKTHEWGLQKLQKD
jgi:hypothetical protein